MSIIEEYQEILTPGELMDILQAFKTLQESGGDGFIQVMFCGSSVTSISMEIKRKTVGVPAIEHAPTCVIDHSALRESWVRYKKTRRLC